MNDTDELGRKLLDWFGPEAAELDQRAREQSGVDPVEVFEHTGVDERWES